MTKIDQINDTITMHATKKPSTPAATPFSASLENALSQKTTDNADIGQTATLSEPKPPVLNQSGTSQNFIVGKTDMLLGLLESYAAGLENPGATLKELASIVDRMKDEAGQLLASTDAHDTGGDEINRIATKAALTANVEYIKFNRGDYL